MTSTMFDANGKELYRDDQVTFWSARTRAHMDGVVLSTRPLGQMVEVHIDGDPFPVNVPMNQLTKQGDAMPAATEERPSRKDMRRLASKLKIVGWEALSTDALWEAIKEAEGTGSNGGKKKSKKDKAKKAKSDAELNDEEWEASPRKKDKTVKTKTKKATKAKSAKKAAPAKKTPKPESRKPAKETADNGNPFRPGTNLALITDELIKGGSRQKMIDRLLKKIDLHPWAKKPKDLDLNFEMDKRVLLAAHMLKDKHGFTVQLEGRGPREGTIVVYPPSAKKAAKAAKTTAKPKVKRAARKVTAKKKGGKKAA